MTQMQGEYTQFLLKRDGHQNKNISHKNVVVQIVQNCLGIVFSSMLSLWCLLGFPLAATATDLKKWGGGERD